MTRNNNIIRFMIKRYNEVASYKFNTLPYELQEILTWKYSECPAAGFCAASDYIDAHPYCCGDPDFIAIILNIYNEIRHTMFRELNRKSDMTVKSWFKSSEVIKGFYGREWTADTLSFIDNGLTFWDVRNRIKHNRALAGDTVTEVWIRFAHRFV